MLINSIGSDYWFVLGGVTLAYNLGNWDENRDIKTTVHLQSEALMNSRNLIDQIFEFHCMSLRVRYNDE